MGEIDLPNTFIIEVNGRFIVNHDENDPEAKGALPARMGELKSAAVFELVGGRLMSGEWSMGILERGSGGFAPMRLWWINDWRSMPEVNYAREKDQDMLQCGRDRMVLALPKSDETWMHIQLPEFPVAGVMKMNWQKGTVTLSGEAA